MRPLDEIEHDARGFSRTRFYFDPPHKEDRGVGTVADVVDFGPRLMATVEDHGDFELSEHIEQHIAEPIARLLNDAPDLVAELKRLRAAVEAIAKRADEDAERWQEDAPLCGGGPLLQMAHFLADVAAKLRSTLKDGS